MKWREFFGMMSASQRAEAKAALQSVNEERRQADPEQPQVVVISAAEVRRSTAQMHVDHAKRGAERYAEQRNRQGGTETQRKVTGPSSTSLAQTAPLAEARQQAEQYAADRNNQAGGAL